MTVDIVPTILLSISAIVMTLSVYMLYRNNQVFKERTKVHNKIFEKQNNHYIWSDEITALLKETNKIATYNQMMHQFWKKPNSFYKEFLHKLEMKKAKIHQKTE